MFKLMNKMGIWTGPIDVVKETIISSNDEVVFINSEALGVSVHKVKHGDKVTKGQ